MSTSGGQPGGYRAVPAGGVYLLAAGPRANNAPANQRLLTAPVYCPYPVTLTGMGANVEAAGGAGATVQPAIYGLAANGGPGNLLIAGPVLNAAAIGAPSGPVAGVIPAGWSWAAMLILAAIAPSPTIETVLNVTTTVFGSPTAVSGVGNDGGYPYATGQAALPAVFAATGYTTIGPAVWIET